MQLANKKSIEQLHQHLNYFQQRPRVICIGLSFPAHQLLGAQHAQHATRSHSLNRAELVLLHTGMLLDCHRRFVAAQLEQLAAAAVDMGLDERQQLLMHGREDVTKKRMRQMRQMRQRLELLRSTKPPQDVALALTLALALADALLVLDVSVRLLSSEQAYGTQHCQGSW
jgi:hypothetical protein